MNLYIAWRRFHPQTRVMFAKLAGVAVDQVPDDFSQFDADSRHAIKKHLHFCDITNRFHQYREGNH